MACGACGNKAAAKTEYEVTLRSVNRTVAEVARVSDITSARIKVAEHARSTGGTGTYRAVPKAGV